MKQNKISFAQAAAVKIPAYERLAQYYETDQMKIIHHANYIRWFEEARVDMMEKIGFGYAKMEGMGILCPVLGVSAEYKQMVHFNDRVSIECRIAEYTGLKLTILYQVKNLETGAVCTTGESRHGFLDASDGHIISLKRNYPEIHQLMLDAMVPAEEA